MFPKLVACGPNETKYQHYSPNCHKKKYQNELVKKRLKNLIQDGLESRRVVGQPKRHYQKLKMAVNYVKGRLKRVIRVQQHLIITRTQVQLGVNHKTMQLI